MKKYQIYTFVISLISVLCVVLIFLIVRINDNQHNHQYVKTIVKEKYYTSHNGVFFYGFFYYGSTNYDFVIVSVEYDQNGNKIQTWTSHVNQETYNSYNQEDTLYICKIHGRVENTNS